jgi:nitrate reductase (NAD(P)H)
MTSGTSSSSSNAGSEGTSSQTTPSTTAPPSPKLPNDNLNLLPSPFYPATFAQREGIPSTYETPALPSYYPPLPSAIRSHEADEKDKGTPDDGIIRDESLVRLTGKWPFNCEPSLPDLWSSVRGPPPLPLPKIVELIS